MSSPTSDRNRVRGFTPYNTGLLRQELTEDEGLRDEVYRCPAGYLTVGIGHNLEGRPLLPDEIELIYTNDVKAAHQTLDLLNPGWRTHPDQVQRALVNLAFNLGFKGWQGFIHTRAAIQRRDYKAAAAGLRASKWAKQVQPSRRDRIIAQIEGTAT